MGQFQQCSVWCLGLRVIFLAPLTQLPQLTNLRLIDSVCEHVGRDWEPELSKVLAKVRADFVCEFQQCVCIQTL
jgi:hypothetical protein